MMWVRTAVPLIVLGVIAAVIIGAATWYALRRRRRERLARAEWQRQENKRIVSEFFDKEFKDLEGS